MVGGRAAGLTARAPRRRAPRASRRRRYPSGCRRRRRSSALKVCMPGSDATDEAARRAVGGGIVGAVGGGGGGGADGGGGGGMRRVSSTCRGCASSTACCRGRGRRRCRRRPAVPRDAARARAGELHPARRAGVPPYWRSVRNGSRRISQYGSGENGNTTAGTLHQRGEPAERHPRAPAPRGRRSCRAKSRRAAAARRTAAAAAGRGRHGGCRGRRTRPRRGRSPRCARPCPSPPRLRRSRRAHRTRARGGRAAGERLREAEALVDAELPPPPTRGAEQRARWLPPRSLRRRRVHCREQPVTAQALPRRRAGRPSARRRPTSRPDCATPTSRARARRRRHRRRRAKHGAGDEGARAEGRVGRRRHRPRLGDAPFFSSHLRAYACAAAAEVGERQSHVSRNPGRPAPGSPGYEPRVSSVGPTAGGLVGPSFGELGRELDAARPPPTTSAVLAHQRVTCALSRARSATIFGAWRSSVIGAASPPAASTA